MIYLGYKLITVSACAAAPVRVEDTDKPLKKNQKKTKRWSEIEGNRLLYKI